jgi:Toastrack DUF4097
MNVKDIKLKKLVKIFSIMAAVSLVLLGIVVLVFDIPAYFRGEQLAYGVKSGKTIDVNMSETFDIDGISSIEADMYFSDILVETNSSDKITLSYVGSFVSGEMIDKPHLLISESSDGLQIKSAFRSGFNTGNSTLVLKLSIPEKLLKELQLGTSSGDIILSGSPSENLILDTASGKISLDGYRGKQLSTDSSSGDHEIFNIEVDALNISSTSGDVTVHSGKLVQSIINTSSGDVTLEKTSSANLKIDLTSGRAKLEKYSGNLDFSSSSGSLMASFESVGNEIRANSSSGDITLIFDADDGFTLNADTSSGDIDIEFPVTMTGNFDKDQFQGSVADGGGRVSIDTSSGDITIKKK